MSQEPPRLLIFFLGEEAYALDLQDVVEVMEPPPCFPIPRAPAHFTGVMNFHGALVPILDMALYLKSGSCAHDGKILVLDSRIATLALWVDGIRTIVPADSFENESEGSDEHTARLLHGSDGVIKLLALDTLLKKLEKSMNLLD